MRVWDINPGYLNRQSLLGEHRELHGIVSVIVNRKKGYSKHHETVRWVGYGWALKQRHKQLACEMILRGFMDKSPVTTRSNKGIWPEVYIDEPVKQFHLLKVKYENKEGGRILLPKNVQQLWSQHKYSVLARDVEIYKELGRDVSVMKVNFAELANFLTELLRKPPSTGGIRNAVQHMWGYVSKHPPHHEGDVNLWPLHRLLQETQNRAMTHGDPYLTSSTALGELAVWLPNA